MTNTVSRRNMECPIIVLEILFFFSRARSSFELQSVRLRFVLKFAILSCSTCQVERIKGSFVSNVSEDNRVIWVDISFLRGSSNRIVLIQRMKSEHKRTMSWKQTLVNRLNITHLSNQITQRVLRELLGLHHFAREDDLVFFNDPRWLHMKR